MDPSKAVPAASGCRWPQSVAEFESLVETLQHELVHFAFCRLHNLQDAEDAVQDVLVRAYLDRGKHKAVTNVCPYLYRMVSNQCVDLLRKRKRNVPLDTAEANALPAGPAGSPDWELAAERSRRIEALLSELPSRQAEVIRLRTSGGLPFQAIAEIVGASVPTTKSRFRYGVHRLSKILGSKEAQP